MGRHTHGSDGQQDLRSQVEYARLLLDSAYEAFVSIDEEGRVTAWNRAAERTFGWKRDEIVGRPLAATIIPPKYREAHLRGIERFLRTGEGPVLNKRLELTALHRNGHEFAVELAIWTVPSGSLQAFCAFIRDISDQKVASERLRESQQQLAEAQAIARIGSWMWDVETSEVRWSEQLCRNYGVDPETFTPSLEGFLWFVHPEDRDRVRAIIETALRTHVFPEFEHRVVLPDGRERVNHCKGEVVVLDGRPVRMVGTSMDVTEQKRSEAVLRSAYDREREMVRKLRQLDADRTSFVSSVSHELRTPLTAILGYLDLLTSGGDELHVTDEQLGMLQVIRRNATRLMNLIEDLLTVSRLEAGTFGLNIAPTRVASIVEAARDAVQPSALSGGVELRVTECQEDCVVMADAVQLERALLNVLSNAIKFTPAGGSVHLHVSVEEDQVRLRVSDTGMGISPDDMPRLFRPFFRSSDAYKQALPGTGLGLVIVRSIMEEHKGSVDITSAPGSGTTVTLRLPALVTREPDRAPAA